MRYNQKLWRCIAGINGAIAIAMGTVAAHVIKTAHMAEIADKASIYQLIHSVALLWLAGQHGKGSALARWLFLAAIVMFCGTLYIKALTGIAGITKLAPMGGICFIAGWLILALAGD